MVHKKYYIRVTQVIGIDLERFCDEQNIKYSQLSYDFGSGSGTALYSIHLNKEDALALKLKFPLIGFTDLKRFLDNQIYTVHHCDDTDTMLKVISKE